MALIIEMQHECSVEIEVAHPGLAGRKEFADFRKHIEILKGLLGERRYTLDSLQNLAAYEQKAAEIVASAFGGPAVVDSTPAEPGKPKAAQPSIDGMPAYQDWEQVKGIAQENLPEALAVNGVPWVMIDKINVMDKESEEAHSLQVIDAKDSYRSRQKLKYPDGTVLEDVGRAHVGGYCTFQVKNVTAGKELAVVRRIDYVYGDYELEFFVDGKSAGISDNKGTDRVFRWRNWPYVVPAEFITKSTISVKQVAVTAGRDINMFRYWFYQPK